MRSLGDQLSVALESARLYQDTLRRALQEQLVGEATARMRETLNMDAVLRTAAREIGETLGLQDVTIRLESDGRGASAEELAG
jgi:GAF domain-containing protein